MPADEQVFFDRPVVCALAAQSFASNPDMPNERHVGLITLKIGALSLTVNLDDHACREVAAALLSHAASTTLRVPAKVNGFQVPRSMLARSGGWLMFDGRSVGGKEWEKSDA